MRSTCGSRSRGWEPVSLTAVLYDPIKAWETNVFPAIRRRFRNENERRDGLEQIKGALALGMLEIARQTVEFLYEENGGIPRDLKVEIKSF